MIVKKRCEAFTSVELLIVVGIISVLSGVVYFIYDSVSDKQQVNSELKNIEVLVGQLKDATISSTYHNISNESLLDYGITYNSSFSSFNINGTSDNSFKVDYKDLNSRQCSDFALKTSGFKGEYVLTRKVNDVVINDNPTKVASECSKDLNTFELEFKGLVLPQIAQVTPGTPKPPPVYAEAGTFIPELPERGEVPTNLSQSTKTVSLPVAPVKGTYIPPVAVTSNPSVVVGGDIFDTSGYVKPVYEDNPPPPVASGEDNTDFRPAIPEPPPPPPPPAPPEPNLNGWRITRETNGWYTGQNFGDQVTSGNFSTRFCMNGSTSLLLCTSGEYYLDLSSQSAWNKFHEKYGLYFISFSTYGPSNWERSRTSYIICAKPAKAFRTFDAYENASYSCR